MTLREVWQRIHEGRWREVIRAAQLEPSLQGIPYLVAAVLVGLTAVLYSTAFVGLIEVAKELADNRPIAFAIGGPACILLSAWLVLRFAPEMSLTGVPQVLRALEVGKSASSEDIYHSVGALMALRFAAVMAVSSLLGVLGGAGLGREGPMVLIAACLFFLVGQYSRRFWPEVDPRSWIVAGGAAGIAAAFQTPLAGVVFVLEELAQQHYREFKTYVMTAVVVAGMIAQWLFGRYLFLGYAKVTAVPVSSVFWACLVGFLAGVGVWLFERGLVIFRARLRFTNAILTAGLLGVAIAFLAIVDSRTVGGGIAFVEDLLFRDARAGWLIILGRYASTALGHLAGCAGGFLAPSLALGAGLGSRVAELFGVPHHNLLVLCGMVAFLGGINRAPFTALVIVMEMTDSHTAIFPLMMAATLGYGAVALLSAKSR